MKIGLVIGIITAAMFAIAFAIVGHIAVRNGAGWDGARYLDFVQQLGAGHPVLGHPYFTIRMSGFGPLILASALGFSRAALIEIQTFINVGMLSVAAALFYSSLRRLGVGLEVAVLSVAALVLSWPFLVLPVFCPVLSDHLALLLSCLCLWSWALSYRWPIYLLCTYCVWVFPGLFVIPLLFAAMPFKMRGEVTPSSPRLPYFVALMAFLVAVSAALVYSAGACGEGPNQFYGAGPCVAVPNLVQVSAAFMIVSVLLAFWSGMRLLAAKGLRSCISPVGLIIGLLCVGGSGFVMFTTLNWASGNRGPPLLHNLLQESLAAPLKPLVSHFLSLGPVMVLVVLRGLGGAFGTKSSIPKPLLAVLASFLPFLALGSESRQWIGVFPIAAAVFALGHYSRLQRIWCLIVSAALLTPAIWLQDSIRKALASDTTNFQSPQWQAYFSRQGPWMSVETYEIGAVALVLFLTVHIILALIHEKMVVASEAKLSARSAAA